MRAAATLARNREGVGGPPRTIDSVIVTATDRARAVIAEMGERRAGMLTVTIGTGCCESTAPFLYEDFWPGPDQEPVGEVGGVVVYAPEYLRTQYSVYATCAEAAALAATGSAAASPRRIARWPASECTFSSAASSGSEIR